jgi:hypothetical protein
LWVDLQKEDLVYEKPTRELEVQAKLNVAIWEMSSCIKLMTELIKNNIKMESKQTILLEAMENLQNFGSNSTNIGKDEIPVFSGEHPNEYYIKFLNYCSNPLSGNEQRWHPSGSLPY